MDSRKTAIVTFFAILMTSPFIVSAHEAWLEPFEFRINTGDELEIDWRVGTEFKGNKQPNIKSWYKAFDIQDSTGTRPVGGELGRRPAGNTVAQADGLNVISYFSNPTILTFRDWGKFTSYADYEGFDGLVKKHEAAGLPKVGFKEAYSRCAKSLVQVGGTIISGEVAPLGLPYELVLLNGLASEGAVEVELLWQGKPAPDAQVRVFEKAGKDTALVGESRVLRTDEKGRVLVAAQKGNRLMLSAVHIASSKEDGVAYESFWANLTFER